MICFVLTIFLSVGMRVYLKWENRRRDREQEMHVDAEDKLMVDFQMDGQLEKVDETDRMNRGFRYVL
jgi:hypothetical protein